MKAVKLDNQSLAKRVASLEEAQKKFSVTLSTFNRSLVDLEKIYDDTKQDYVEPNTEVTEQTIQTKIAEASTVMLRWKGELHHYKYTQKEQTAELEIKRTDLEHSKLLEEINGLKGQIKTLEDDKIKIAEKLERTNKDLVQLNEKMTLDSKHLTAQNELSIQNYERQIEQITEKLSQHKEIVQILKDNLKETASEKNLLQQELTEQITELSKLKKTRAEEEDVLKIKSKQIETLEALTKQNADQINSSIIKANQAKEEVQRLHDEKITFEQRLETQTRSFKESEAKTSKLKEEIEEKNAQLAEQKIIHQNLLENLMNSEAKIYEVKDTIEEERLNLAKESLQFKENLNIKQEELKILSAEYNRHLKREALHKDELDNLRKESEAKIHNLAQNVEISAGKIRKLEEENKSTLSSLDLKEARIKELDETLKKESERTLEMSKMIEAQEEEIQELTKAKEQLLGNIQTFQSEIVDFEVLLRKEKDRQSTEMMQISQEIGLLKNNNYKLILENNTFREKDRTVEESIKRLSADYQQVLQEKEELISKGAALQGSRDTLHNEMQKLQSLLESRERELAKIQADLEKVRTESKNKEERILELRGTAEKENGDIAKESDELREAIRMKEAEIVDLNNEKNKLIKDLESARVSGEDNMTKLKAEIDRERQKNAKKNRELEDSLQKSAALVKGSHENSEYLKAKLKAKDQENQTISKENEQHKDRIQEYTATIKQLQEESSDDKKNLLNSMEEAAKLLISN